MKRSSKLLILGAVLFLVIFFILWRQRRAKEHLGSALGEFC
jgi:preprotein translocase subunit YajC